MLQFEDIQSSVPCWLSTHEVKSKGYRSRPLGDFIFRRRIRVSRTIFLRKGGPTTSVGIRDSDGYQKMVRRARYPSNVKPRNKEVLGVFLETEIRRFCLKICHISLPCCKVMKTSCYIGLLLSLKAVFLSSILHRRWDILSLKHS